MTTTYKDAGVDRELGDDVSEMLYNAARQTWDNRKGGLGELIVPFDDFSGVRAINASNLKDGTLMNIGFDGVGTKMELAERIGDHSTIAYDLFAMVCDDAVVRGAEPVMIGSILDVNSLKDRNDKPYFTEVKQLAEGYINAANAAHVAVVNGEVAELGNRVGGYGSNNFVATLAHEYIAKCLNQHNYKSISKLSWWVNETNEKKRAALVKKMSHPEIEFVDSITKLSTLNYNWGAAVVWFADEKRMFTGKEIQEGDTLVGLREEGFRSNGLSLVRKIMEKNYGDEWHNEPFSDRTLGEAVLTPSRIYTKAVVDMFGGYNGEPKAKVHGVAHITGGGIPEKLGRMLKPSGLGAVIDKPFIPPQIMAHVQRTGYVTDEEAYETWNMGQGMVIATPDERSVIKVAQQHGIEAKKIGKVTSAPGIAIVSGGAESYQKTLHFNID